MIIAHLIYDKYNLFACSLTCYSWYIATVPHLHRTYTAIFTHSWQTYKTRWPIPLLYTHRLGLLPLVKKLRISQGAPYESQFSPEQLSLCFLPRFFALNNVRELEIERLDIPAFIPKVRRYFRSLLPTVRSLTLGDPKGCYHQIVYFIGLFQHLEDLGLFFELEHRFLGEHTHDPTLTPPFAPPLRGSLTMRFIQGAILSKHMIDLFGGVRFRRMNLRCVDGTSLLLDACAKTLETLRLRPNDPYGEQRCPNMWKVQPTIPQS